jgi:hypothetical protein
LSASLLQKQGANVLLLSPFALVIGVTGIDDMRAVGSEQILRLIFWRKPAIQLERTGPCCAYQLVVLLLAAFFKHAYFLQILFWGVDGQRLDYLMSQHNKFVIAMLEIYYIITP